MNNIQISDVSFQITTALIVEDLIFSAKGGSAFGRDN